jgi:hypothetical protein
MSTFDSQVSKREIIEMQIEHTRLSFLDRQSSDQNFSSRGIMFDFNFYLFSLNVILHQFWVKKIFPGKFIWNTVVLLLSYSCMFDRQSSDQNFSSRGIMIGNHRKKNPKVN